MIVLFMRSTKPFEDGLYTDGLIDFTPCNFQSALDQLFMNSFSLSDIIDYY